MAEHGTIGGERERETERSLRLCAREGVVLPISLTRADGDRSLSFGRTPSPDRRHTSPGKTCTGRLEQGHHAWWRHHCTGHDEMHRDPSGGHPSTERKHIVHEGRQVGRKVQVKSRGRHYLCRNNNPSRTLRIRGSFRAVTRNAVRTPSHPIVPSHPVERKKEKPLNAPGGWVGDHGHLFRD
jgi:hypothetical protein